MNAPSLNVPPLDAASPRVTPVTMGHALRCLLPPEALHRVWALFSLNAPPGGGSSQAPVP